MLCYTGKTRSEFKETPLTSEVSRGNSCLFFNFAWLEWCIEQQWGESIKWATFRVCLVTSDGSRIGAKLISAGPFLYAAFLLLYRQFKSEFAPAAELWLSASSVNVCICGAEGKLATVNHLQTSDVTSRVALTGPNSLLTCLLINTSGTGWKSLVAQRRKSEMKEIFVDRSGWNWEPAFHFFQQTFIIARCHARTTATTRCQMNAVTMQGGWNLKRL